MRMWWLAPLGLIASGALAQPADPETGREIAERWCTSCHVVTPGGPGADAGPPLPELMRGGQRTADELRGWLAAPHPPMPDLDLTRQEIEDIVAYLESLGAP
jgi:cytochrome c